MRYSERADACVLQSIGWGKRSFGMDGFDLYPYLQERLANFLWKSQINQLNSGVVKLLCICYCTEINNTKKTDPSKVWISSRPHRPDIHSSSIIEAFP